tara:strand:- start:525 stop:770 length:246 start_codon:yes stop_codon:yes gene_type:complete
LREYINIVDQLTESLDCDANEIVDIVNVLNMTEYWVENKMLDLCEDNNVMRKVLEASLREFIQKYKSQSLSLNELYDGSER